MKFLFSTLIVLYVSFIGNDTQKKKWFEIRGTSIIFIEQINDTNLSQYSFFTKSKTFSSSEKLEMIEELLSFEGDKRISKPFISNYNKNLSQFYHGKSKNTTVEIEALMLINQLYFDNPFYYSLYAVIINKYGNEISRKKSGMKKVYCAYKNWFNKVKEIGFDKAREEKLRPFSKSKFKWIHGIDVDPLSPLQFELDPN